MAKGSPSKNAQQRRDAKAAARFERAEAARKQRRRVNWILAIGAVALAIVVWVIWTTAGDSPAPSPSEAPSETSTDAESEAKSYESAPPASEAEGRMWQATLHTNVGDIVVELDGAAAPQAVASFLMLARDGFYNDTSCHRLLPDSLLQCGDPTGTGRGGPGYAYGPVENAPSDDIYPPGTLAMARVGNDGMSMGSQFFLVFNEVTLPSDSAGGYTVFGTVTQGLEILQSVGAAGTTTGSADGPPAEAVIIEEVTIE